MNKKARSLDELKQQWEEAYNRLVRAIDCARLEARRLARTPIKNAEVDDAVMELSYSAGIAEGLVARLQKKEIPELNTTKLYALFGEERCWQGLMRMVDY